MEFAPTCPEQWIPSIPHDHRQGPWMVHDLLVHLAAQFLGDNSPAFVLSQIIVSPPTLPACWAKGRKLGGRPCNNNQPASYRLGSSSIRPVSKGYFHHEKWTWEYKEKVASLSAGSPLISSNLSRYGKEDHTIIVPAALLVYSICVPLNVYLQLVPKL